MSFNKRIDLLRTTLATADLLRAVAEKQDKDVPVCATQGLVNSLEAWCLKHVAELAPHILEALPEKKRTSIPAIRDALKKAHPA